MKNFLAFVAALVLVVVFAGWYLGWFEISHKPMPDGHHSVEIDIDRDKLVDDVKKGSETVLKEGRERLEKLLEKKEKDGKPAGTEERPNCRCRRDPTSATEPNDTRSRRRSSLASSFVGRSKAASSTEFATGLGGDGLAITSHDGQCDSSASVPTASVRSSGPHKICDTPLSNSWPASGLAPFAGFHGAVPSSLAVASIAPALW
jgi:hypothetical protein